MRAEGAVQEDPTQLADETEVRDERTPRYRLPVFEGPLDLLLYLIQKNEIDIADIPITRITEQYTAYLDQMRELDLEIAADYVLMAATLIHIKTRMLLPVSRETGEDQGLDDPRIPLVEQLMEYKRFKEIARLLQEKEEAESAQFPRAAAGQLAEMAPVLMELDVDLFDLVEALQRVLRRAADRRERLVFAPEVTPAESEGKKCLAHDATP